MKKIIYLLAFLALAGCETEIKGTLQVFSTMTVISGSSYHQIPAGNYHATYEADNDATYAVLRVENVGGKTLKIRMNFPAGNSAPTSYGGLNLSSAVSGQPFDLTGGIDTDYDSSQPYASTKSCTYYLNEYTCHYQDGKQICGYESIAHTGSQPAQTYSSSTNTKVSASFKKPGTSFELARFSGSEYDTDYHSSATGPCAP